MVARLAAMRATAAGVSVAGASCRVTAAMSAKLRSPSPTRMLATRPLRCMLSDHVVARADAGDGSQCTALAGGVVCPGGAAIGRTMALSRGRTMKAVVAAFRATV